MNRRFRPMRVLRAVHLNPWPTAWGLVAVIAYLLGRPLGWPDLLLGMLLAVPLMLTTVGLGWRAGVALLPFGLALLAVGGATADGWIDYLGVGVVTALAIVAGHSLFLVWRRTEIRARSDARRAMLLTEATAELQAISERAEMYRALPRLLGEILDFAHAEVLGPGANGLEPLATLRWHPPPGFCVPYESVSGRALRDGKEIYVPDTRRHPDYVSLPDAPDTRSQLVFPLRVDGEVVAVFNIEHAEVDGFGPRDRSTLLALGRIAEAALERIVSSEELLRQHDEQGRIADLTGRLARAASAEQAGAWALDALCEKLDLELGMILTLRQGRFRPLVLSGEPPERVQPLIAAGLERKRGLVDRSWQHRREIFIEDYRLLPDADPLYRELGARAMVFVPILTPEGEALALVHLISYRRSRSFEEQDRHLLRIVADTLGVVFQRTILNRQLGELLEMVKTLAQADDPEKLYARAVEAAVRLIPGAEAASILVRSNEGFSFAAAEGYPIESLRGIRPFSEEEHMTWYGGDPEDFRRGVPRLLRGNISTVSRSAAPGADFDAAARLSELQANICVPITYHGEAIGLLNIDSLTAEDAFSPGALELAEAFGQQIAVIIRQTQDRRALERSAITDALTGLGNREGFNRQLRTELARAKRYGYPLHLLMLDLNRFKEINDTLGHQAGDRALVAAARAMEKQLREGDSLFRWGGDEFALLLPHVSALEAEGTAARYVDTVGQLRIGPFELGLSVGIAGYPEDGDDSEILLKRADDLMYRHKHGRTQNPSPKAD